MANSEIGAHRDADAVLTSLSLMVARSSAAGTLPENWVTDLVRADPTGAKLCAVVERANRASARFGADFLRDAGRALFDPARGTPYDGGLAWLGAMRADLATALAVLEDRELAGWLLSLRSSRRAVGRARADLLHEIADLQGPERVRRLELAAWVRETWTGARAEGGPALDGPFDGFAALVAGDVMALDEVAADEHHPGREATMTLLARMKGDQIAVSAVADACARYNRIRILGVAAQERPAAVRESCRLLEFVLRPMVGESAAGEPGQSYVGLACDLMAMTALWAVLRDGGEARPEEIIPLWPGAHDGVPARLGQLGRERFRQILEAASTTPGMAAELIDASRQR